MSYEIIEEWDCAWIGYVIDQNDTELKNKIEGLQKKKGWIVDVVFRKLFCKYEKGLITQYGVKGYQEGLSYAGHHYFEERYYENTNEEFIKFIPLKNLMTQKGSGKLIPNCRVHNSVILPAKNNQQCSSQLTYPYI